MKKVIVIGSGGAGKSTFSRQMGDITGLPVVHLDLEYWRPGWVKTPKDEWNQKVTEMIARDEWIMDGNFGGTRELRAGSADTIVFLDIPRRVCIYRVCKRYLRFRGGNRPEMSEGCNEKLDLEFLLWI